MNVKNMNEDKMIALIHQHLSDQISAADLVVLDEWRLAKVENEAMYQSVADAWSAVEVMAPVNWDTDNAWEKFEKNISFSKTVASEPIAKKKSMWSRWAVAASLFLLVAAGGFYFYQINKTNILMADAAQEDINITLSDGTVVHLRQGSTLSYPESFANKREVRMTGEAYFDVARDEAKPFRVYTNQAEVTVLGTEFDIDATKEKLGETYIYVTEGKVDFRKINSKTGLDVTVGQKAYIKPYRNAYVTDYINNPNFNAIAWHTKELTFDNVAMNQVTKDLAAFYNVTFDLSKTTIEDCGYYSPLPINDLPLATVLATFEDIYKCTTTVEGDKVTIVGGACVMFGE